MRAGIALGSNIGDRLGNLKNARAQIGEMPMIRPPILASSIYETEPVGCEPGAPSFLNAVIEVDSGATAAELLAGLRGIEAAAGRLKKHARNAPRTLDLDLLYHGEQRVTADGLELPHPRMHERGFVLAPLAEIRPDLVLPGQRENVATLLRNLLAAARVVRVASEW